MRLFIIDMMNLAFRSYYGYRDLATSTGRPTGVCYGFSKTIQKIIEEYNPTHMVVAKEGGGKTFRHELYEDYKSNRSDKPIDLDPQIQDLIKMIQVFGIPTVSAKGFEADDVIGTLAKRFASPDCHVFIASGDKDFMQLVGPNVSLLRLTNFGHQLAGRDEVLAKFGVEPEQVVDCLALMGDSSDMVPGVAGIGEKGAAKLISAHGSIETLYDNLDKLAPKLAQKLVKDKDSAFLSKSLVTIIQDVPIDVTLDDLVLRGAPSLDDLVGLFKELEFNG
jgi:DNA polymerase-1